MSPPPGLFRHAHWMLFGLLASLALSFWLGGVWFGKKIEDTYVDEGRLQALRSFEPAIVLQAAAPGPEPEALRAKFPCASPARLDRLARQLAAIQAGLERLSQPGKRLRLDPARWSLAGSTCAEVLEAAAWLAQDAGRRLELLDWPGLWRARFETVMKVPEAIFRQDNPWRGADGCVYLGPASDGRLLYVQEQRGSAETCPAMAGVQPEQTAGVAQPRGGRAADDGAWAIPEDLNTILADLGRIRRPEGPTYQLFTQPPDPEAPADAPKPHGPNTIARRGREAPAGFNVFLTLNPKTQALAQQWAECYAGSGRACDIAGLDGDDKLSKLAGEMYEGAAVRMAAVAVIDVASGRIEALGSAHTACYRQDHDGPGHDAGCPDLPFRPRPDRDRLLNHALFVDALPASTVKPILALAFLQDSPAFQAGPAKDALWHDLKTSNSRAFLDRLFCGDATVPEGRRWQWRECRRPTQAQAAAGLLGWNLGCEKGAGKPECAKLDLLFGRPAALKLFQEAGRQPLSLPLLYGRLFTAAPDAKAESEDAGPDWTDADAPQGYRLLEDFRFDPSFAAGCKAQEWRRCKGLGRGGQIANEGWGQGEGRATAAGVAGMLARLAAAANGQPSQAFPHLVDHIGDSQGRPYALPLERLAGPQPLNIPQELARLVLDGMGSHRAGGTAHDACAALFDGKTCDQIAWLAGKTGTPPFRFDTEALPQIQKTCPAGAARLKAICNVLPYKWYVAAFKTRGFADAPYDKVVAVLTERNWVKKTGRVQSPGDKERNLSAELALRLAKALRQDPPLPAKAKP